MSKTTTYEVLSPHFWMLRLKLCMQPRSIEPGCKSCTAMISLCGTMYRVPGRNGYQHISPEDIRNAIDFVREEYSASEVLGLQSSGPPPNVVASVRILPHTISNSRLSLYPRSAPIMAVDSWSHVHAMTMCCLHGKHCIRLQAKTTCKFNTVSQNSGMHSKT